MIQPVTSYSPELLYLVDQFLSIEDVKSRLCSNKGEMDLRYIFFWFLEQSEEQQMKTIAYMMRHEISSSIIEKWIVKSNLTPSSKACHLTKLIGEAAQRLHSDLLVRFWELAANHDLSNELGKTIVLAANAGSVACTEWLLGHHFEAVCSHLLEACLKATKKGHLQILQRLFNSFTFENQNINKLLVLAASNGHVEIASFLLDHGANIEHESGLALREAVTKGHAEMVGWLIAQGANVGTSKRGAISIAIGMRRTEITDLLITERPECLTPGMRRKALAVGNARIRKLVKV